jgi:hypothetical protein
LTEERWIDLDTEERELLEHLGMKPPGESGPFTTCPPPELLSAYKEDVLPEELQRGVEAHVAQCMLCQSLQRDLPVVSQSGPGLTPGAEARIRARLPRRVEPKPGRGAARSSTWLWRPALGFAAVAVIVIVVFFRQSKPAEPAPNVETSAAQTQGPATNLIAIEKPAVKLTASALVFRGDGRNGNRFTHDLAPALNSYRADNYVDAAKRLADLTSKYPGSVEVSFYLGVSRLYTNDYAGAVAALEAAREIADPSFSYDVAWYLMLAHQRAGNLDAAETERKQICEGHGPYSSKACAARVR